MLDATPEVVLDAFRQLIDHDPFGYGDATLAAEAATTACDHLEIDDPLARLVIRRAIEADLASQRASYMGAKGAPRPKLVKDRHADRAVAAALAAIIADWPQYPFGITAWGAAIEMRRYVVVTLLAQAVAEGDPADAE